MLIADWSVEINVREYGRGNKKRTIQRNWQHGEHKTKKNKTKTQQMVIMLYLPRTNTYYRLTT
jgi:ArsR family metal-binding transcriptional regulator